MGQSNAANYVNHLNKPKKEVYIFNVFNENFYLAEDPLPGATGSDGSIWGYLGDSLIDANIAHSICYANIAVGGSFIKDWTPGMPLNRRLLLAIQRLLKLRINIDAILWCQGEAEANSSYISKDEYKKNFMEMYLSIRESGIRAPILVSKSTICNINLSKNTNNRDAVRIASAELVNPSQGILEGPDLDKIGESGRYDGCHFNKDGAKEAARLWLISIIKNKEHLFVK